MNMSDVSIYVVVPVFNEEIVLADVVCGLKKNFTNIVCVDDGSKDTSYQILSNLGVEALRHSCNLGQGAALKTGIEYALSKGADYIITFDSDGQHLPLDALCLVKKAIELDVDLMLGNRFINDSGEMPKFRKFMLKSVVLFNKLFLGLDLGDTHNGLRCLNFKFASQLEFLDYRMGHASDFLRLIKGNKFTYAEYPVSIKYTKYSKSKGQSSMNAINIAFDSLLNKLR